MRLHRLSQRLPISMEAAWEFLTNRENLDEMTREKFRFETISGDGEPMYPGQIIVHRMRLAPMIYRNWVTEIKRVDPGKSFIDEQRSGPDKFWHHRHHLEGMVTIPSCMTRFTMRCRLHRSAKLPMSCMCAH